MKISSALSSQEIANVILSASERKFKVIEQDLVALEEDAFTHMVLSDVQHYVCKGLANDYFDRHKTFKEISQYPFFCAHHFLSYYAYRCHQELNSKHMTWQWEKEQLDLLCHVTEHQAKHLDTVRIQKNFLVTLFKPLFYRHFEDKKDKSASDVPWRLVKVHYLVEKLNNLHDHPNQADYISDLENALKIKTPEEKAMLILNTVMCSLGDIFSHSYRVECAARAIEVMEASLRVEDFCALDHVLDKVCMPKHIFISSLKNTLSYKIVDYLANHPHWTSIEEHAMLEAFLPKTGLPNTESVQKI